MVFSKLIGAITSALILFIVASCVDGTCYDDTEAFAGAAFFSGSAQKSPTTLTLSGSGMEGKIYNNKASVSLALLPLDPKVGGCSFDITINGTPDNITLNYTATPLMVSGDCGYTFEYSLISVASSNNIIDSVVITNTRASISNEENIRIYY